MGGKRPKAAPKCGQLKTPQPFIYPLPTGNPPVLPWNSVPPALGSVVEHWGLETLKNYNPQTFKYCISTPNHSLLLFAMQVQTILFKAAHKGITNPPTGTF